MQSEIKKNTDRNLFKCFACERDQCLACVQSRRYSAWKAAGTAPGAGFDAKIRFNADFDEKKREEKKVNNEDLPPSYDQVLAMREEEAIFKLVPRKKAAI